jgi:hypothetical protein
MNVVRIYLDRKPNSLTVCGRKWLGKAFLYAAGLIGIGAVSFLSLSPSSAIRTFGWMPVAIANWADSNGRFDNFPAYGRSFFLIASTFRQQAWTIAILSLLIVSLELTRLVIPTRHCDIWDTFLGCMGLLAAWTNCEVLKISIGSKPKSVS